jgi:hypothetical protein
MLKSNINHPDLVKPITIAGTEIKVPIELPRLERKNTSNALEILLR